MRLLLWGFATFFCLLNLSSAFRSSIDDACSSQIGRRSLNSRSSVSSREPAADQSRRRRPENILKEGPEDSAGQAKSCPNSDSTNNTRETRCDPDYLPSGYYDALENPISEEEYLQQVAYERYHGVPYVRNRMREQANLKKPLSLLVFSEIECGGYIMARIKERGTCYQATQSLSISVDSLPSDCAVITFTDSSCQVDPFDMIPILSDTSGCHSTDAFHSIHVACQPLPV